ncbi:MFS transporter, ACS family, hexuronate transporter [Porphyromonadaceae bacterium NLAE-zl-C104]|nr:MFS transporter [Parabacteroides sp.]SEA03654.1 MFS transporter, ACS family, hexuronate transporter [Porphyromonadaceae bacterium KH3R12]SFS48574.1 MFS transporter, ACS family, hexuronate transporter [Porphyromonadaceae bacterium NLAE-zl-C104]
MKRVYFDNGNLRWKIALLLCLASGLNALDRNAFAILASTIQGEFNWSDIDYANLTSVFVFSYTLMYALSGKIIDRIGTRKGFGIAVGSWSFVAAMHAVVHSLAQFSIVRFFLGITESANFPAGVKASTEWFPLKERALAIGIFNAGTAIGAAVAVPLVSFLALAFGWRIAFLATGILGFVWLFFWLRNYHRPQDHPNITQEEKEYILQDDTPKTEGEGEEKIKLKDLLKKKETWGCFSARIFIDPVTYFLLFWIPKYLQDVQGLSLKELGFAAWLPYTAMGLGTILGGYIPKLLIERRGWTLNKSRKTVMVTASVLIPLLCFFLFSGANPIVAVLLISGIMLSHGLWANITIPSEIYPKQVQATLTGIGGTLGGITGVISQQVIGSTITSHSYMPIFMYIGGAYLISFFCVQLLVGKLGVIRNFNN